MDLFKLFGSIVIKNSDANDALDKTSKKGQDAESKLSKSFKAIGKGAVAVGKTVAVGLGAGATAIAGLVAKSTSAYAEYEQLVGGVDTLFKESSAKVQEYAEQAYATAGMSANQYMEMVTSFSASLLQSLGGDTKKSADVADRAIIDMSDNANKMGTSMEMIQNAYQGFAKQNYTMLDNLKLGYGGTKEEMQRLIEDASKMTDVQKELGVTVDAGSMSFANIVNAISVVQKQMGITGTTADEAGKTITGSMSSVKASWTNLVTAMASDELPLDEYINKFVESASTMAGNMLPRIQKALGGAVQLINQLAPMIIEQIPTLLTQLLPSVIEASVGLIQSIVSMLPDLVTMLTDSVIPALIDAIVPITNALVEALPDIVEAISGALPDILPLLVDALVDLMVLMVENFGTIIQPVLDALPDIVSSLVTGIGGSFSELDTGMQLLAVAVGVVTAAITANTIANNLKALAVASGTVAEGSATVAMGLHTVATNIATVATTAFGSAMAFLTSPITLVILAIGALIAIIVLVVKNWDKIKEAGAKAWEGIKNAWAKAGEWFAGIWNNIKSAFANVGSWFSNIFTQAWNAIVSIFSRVGEFFGGIWDTIKTTFSNLGTTIGDAISGAVKTGINNLISGAENIINGFFKLINGAVDIINEIPGVNISKIKLVEFTRLAKGGVVDRPTPAIFGEDGAEAVVPLENNTGWLNKVALRLHELNAQRSGLDGLSMRSVELQNAQVSELRTLNNTAFKILEAILTMDENMGGHMREALEGMSWDINKREFARLVRGAI